MTGPDLEKNGMDGGSGWGRDGFGSGTGLDPDSISSSVSGPGKEWWRMMNHGKYGGWGGGGGGG